jgi:tRNA-specific 2-thiouridylase
MNVEVVSIEAGSAVMKFDETKDNITSGQSLVVYDGEICVGGGIII